MIGELCFPVSRYTVMHEPHRGDTFAGFPLTKLTQFEPFTDHAPSDFDTRGYDNLCDVKHNPGRFATYIRQKVGEELPLLSQKCKENLLKLPFVKMIGRFVPKDWPQVCKWKIRFAAAANLTFRFDIS